MPWACLAGASLSLCYAPKLETATVRCAVLVDALGCSAGSAPPDSAAQRSGGLDLRALCPAECGSAPPRQQPRARRALQTDASSATHTTDPNSTAYYRHLGGSLGRQNASALAPPCGPSANCTRGEASSMSVSSVLLRLLPMASSVFVTYFGTKISTMVRVFSVFWASAAPSLLPTLKVIEVEGGISAATFVGLGGSVYAGSLGAFAAVKKREMGIMVQGVAVGYVLSSVLQGFVIGLVLQEYPEAEKYLEWITMVFTFSLGGVIGKIALKYEDLISVCATAIMGAYTGLQVFCSLGFEFSQSLSMQAAMDGTFGCVDWPCQLTLVCFILYALGGVKNQFHMNRVNRLMEENPDFEGDGR